MAPGSFCLMQQDAHTCHAQRGWFEMTLEDVPTYELVAELSKREGVERVDVAPHTQAVEVAVNEGSTYPYDKMMTGPAIILIVTD